MNLIDAIKSGKPIRRAMPDPAMRNLNSWVCSKHMLDALSQGDLSPFSREDFLADDWEIQEPTVTITRTQFWEAVNQSFGIFGMIYKDGLLDSVGITDVRLLAAHGPLGVLARKLGLEEK